MNASGQGYGVATLIAWLLNLLSDTFADYTPGVGVQAARPSRARPKERRTREAR